MRLISFWKNVSKWLVLALSTSSLLGACASSSWSKSPATGKQKATNFRFEEYNSAESAQQKLKILFPDGTRYDNLAQLMASMHSVCYEHSGTEIGPNWKAYASREQVACRYTQPSFLVSPVWIVAVDVDKNQTMHNLSVERDFIGP